MTHHPVAEQAAGRERHRTSSPHMPRLLYAVLVLSTIGFAISGYLTYAHFNEAALACSVGGCETVQSSRYSTIGPVPIAMLGMVMFTSMFILSVVRLKQISTVSAETVSVVAWGILLAGILYYLYLTYVELFVLNAICQWCVLSSLAAAGIFGLESIFLYRTVMDDDPMEAG